MRIVQEIPHPQCRITIFHWNNRYIIKLERDLFEQTFKINQFDVTTEDEVMQLMDTTFINEAIDRFNSMAQSLQNSMKKL